jgi:hypothetical protein
MLQPDLTRNTTSNSNLKYPDDVTDILDTVHRLRLTGANKAIKIETIEVSLYSVSANPFLRAHHKKKDILSEG